MSFENALDQYKKNEMKSHVKIDDVIIKAVQEVGEMIETKTENNLENLAKETADAVVNILSASKWVDVVPDSENIVEKLHTSDTDLFIHMKRRTQGIQWLRKRYSRDNVTKEELKTITEEFLSHVLSYGWVKKSFEEILQTNTNKTFAIAHIILDHEGRGITD